jgi:hypothetical protein
MAGLRVECGRSPVAGDALHTSSEFYLLRGRGVSAILISSGFGAARRKLARLEVK